MKLSKNLMTLSLPFAAAFVFSGIAAAATQLSVGDRVGNEENAIVSAMKASGYTDIEVELEDGVFEVESTFDGIEYEFEVSVDTGEVLSVDEDEMQEGTSDEDDS